MLCLRSYDFYVQNSIDPTGEFTREKSMLDSLRFRGNDAGESIRRELLEVQCQCDMKFEKLKDTLESDIGLELLHLFILDLIGRDTPAAKIFVSKTNTEYVLSM